VKKYILVVDDEQIIRDVIVEYLTTLGLHCLEARDGEEAIEVMNKYRLDKIDMIMLAIVDVHMPKMDGLKLLKAIKAVMPNFPVILMTGLKLTEKEIDIMKVKADEYLPKPLKLDTLYKSLKRLLKNEVEI